MIPNTPHANEYKEARVLHANARITIYTCLISELENNNKLPAQKNWTEIMGILKFFEKGGQDSSLADLIESNDATSIALHAAQGRFFAHKNTRPLINRLFAFPFSRQLEPWIKNALEQSNGGIDVRPTETFLDALQNPEQDKNWLFVGEISTILISHTLYGSFLEQTKGLGKFKGQQAERIALAGLALFLAAYMYRVLPIAHIHYTQVEVRRAYQANALTLASFPIHPFARAATETLAAGGALNASKLTGKLDEDGFAELANKVTTSMLGSTIQEGSTDTGNNSPQGYFFWTALGEGMRAHLIAGAFIYAMFDKDAKGSNAKETVSLKRAQNIQNLLLGGYELPTIQLNLLRGVSSNIDGRKDGGVKADYMSQSRAVFSANFYWLRSLYQAPNLAALEQAPEAWSPDSLNNIFVEKAIEKSNRTKS